MIKGVNRQVIEVTNLDNLYYEKAFLVIKPQYSDYQEKMLRKEAKKLVSNIGYPSLVRRKTQILGWVIKMFLAAGVGAGITAAMIM